jgi:hypothetical protein
MPFESSMSEKGAPVIATHEATTSEGSTKPLVNSEGVELTQIRALKAMTPTERTRAHQATANNLSRLRRSARRL